MTNIQTKILLTNKEGCHNKTFWLWWSCMSCTYSLANSEQILQHQSSLVLYNYSEQSELTQFHRIGQIQHISVSDWAGTQTDSGGDDFYQGHQEHTHSMKGLPHHTAQIDGVKTGLCGGINKSIVTQWHIYVHAMTNMSHYRVKQLTN